YLHADSNRFRYTPFLSAVWIQAEPEAELRWCALRLEDDGWQAHRPAPQAIVSRRRSPCSLVSPRGQVFCLACGLTRPAFQGVNREYSLVDSSGAFGRAYRH